MARLRDAAVSTALILGLGVAAGAQEALPTLAVDTSAAQVAITAQGIPGSTVSLSLRAQDAGDVHLGVFVLADGNLRIALDLPSTTTTVGLPFDVVAVFDQPGSAGSFARAGGGGLGHDFDGVNFGGGGGAGHDFDGANFGGGGGAGHDFDGANFGGGGGAGHDFDGAKILVLRNAFVVGGGGAGHDFDGASFGGGGGAGHDFDG